MESINTNSNKNLILPYFYFFSLKSNSLNKHEGVFWSFDESLNVWKAYFLINTPHIYTVIGELVIPGDKSSNFKEVTGTEVKDKLGNSHLIPYLSSPIMWVRKLNAKSNIWEYYGLMKDINFNMFVQIELKKKINFIESEKITNFQTYSKNQIENVKEKINWTLENSQWKATGSNGSELLFQITGKITITDNEKHEIKGSELSRIPDKGSRVFIPDLNSSLMWIRCCEKDKKWQLLQEMFNINGVKTLNRNANISNRSSNTSNNEIKIESHSKIKIIEKLRFKNFILVLPHYEYTVKRIKVADGCKIGVVVHFMNSENAQWGIWMLTGKGESDSDMLASIGELVKEELAILETCIRPQISEALEKKDYSFLQISDFKTAKWNYCINNERAISKSNYLLKIK